jgi:hypothetical protein
LKRLRLILALALIASVTVVGDEYPKLVLKFDTPTAADEFAFVLTLTNTTAKPMTVAAFTNAFLGHVYVQSSDGATLDLCEDYGLAVMLTSIPILVPKTAQAFGEVYSWRLPASNLRIFGDEERVVSISQLTGRVAFAELRHVEREGHSETNLFSGKIRIRVDPSVATNDFQRPRRALPRFVELVDTNGATIIRHYSTPKGITIIRGSEVEFIQPDTTNILIERKPDQK